MIHPLTREPEGGYRCGVMAKLPGDDEFWKWATTLKPCRYCEQLFLGPVCPCERQTEHKDRSK